MWVYGDSRGKQDQGFRFRLMTCSCDVRMRRLSFRAEVPGNSSTWSLPGGPIVVEEICDSLQKTAGWGRFKFSDLKSCYSFKQVWSLIGKSSSGSCLGICWKNSHNYVLWLIKLNVTGVKLENSFDKLSEHANVSPNLSNMRNLFLNLC